MLDNCHFHAVIPILLKFDDCEVLAKIKMKGYLDCKYKHTSYIRDIYLVEINNINCNGNYDESKLNKTCIYAIVKNSVLQYVTIDKFTMEELYNIAIKEDDINVKIIDIPLNLMECINDD